MTDDDLGDKEIPRNEQEALAAFQAIMLKKLRKNVHKGGWQGQAPHLLLARAFDEMCELVEAMGFDPSVTRPAIVIRLLKTAAEELRSMSNVTLEGQVYAANEAADVANFLMMVVDSMGVLKPNEP